MTTDEHALNLGWLLSNLQSLEFSLRFYLQKHVSTKPLGHAYGESYYDKPIGAEVDENEITNYDTLGILMNKFNNAMRLEGRAELDLSLVDLRDSLAHGRIASMEEENQYRLIKYSKPVNGKAKILFNEKLTEEWFKKNRRCAYDALMYVNKLY